SCRRRRSNGPGQRDLGGMDPRPPGAVAMGAPTLAGLAAAISIAIRRIEVRELSFRLFNGDQRPVTILRPAVTENPGGHRMRGATSKKPEKRIEQSASRPEYGRGTG